MDKRFFDGLNLDSAFEGPWLEMEIETNGILDDVTGKVY